MECGSKLGLVKSITIPKIQVPLWLIWIQNLLSFTYYSQSMFNDLASVSNLSSFSPPVSLFCLQHGLIIPLTDGVIWALSLKRCALQWFNRLFPRKKWCCSLNISAEQIGHRKIRYCNNPNISSFSLLNNLTELSPAYIYAIRCDKFCNSLHPSHLFSHNLSAHNCVLVVRNWARGASVCRIPNMDKAKDDICPEGAHLDTNSDPNTEVNIGIATSNEHLAVSSSKQQGMFHFEKVTPHETIEAHVSAVVSSEQPRIAQLNPGHAKKLESLFRNYKILTTQIWLC